MLSVANVRSASAAASYFAADNYYARADADRSGQWLGKGADLLGLKGEVETAAFDALLRGELPDGSSVGNPGQKHRAGTDLTFSLPKSWSLLALVGKDQRIIEAYREAVIETLTWAEKNAAETRLVEQGKLRTVVTGNLAMGLFQHHTNRNQEPNLHFHAIVANVARGPDGVWRTLKNDKLWSLNTLLNSIAMARFRTSVEKLGYAVGPTLKHGNFEAKGITREQLMAFSTRRQEVLAARQGPGLEAGRIAALATRAPKEGMADRTVLGERWDAAARDVGLNLKPLVEAALLKAGQPELAANRPANLIERGRALLAEFAARIRGDVPDPLVPSQVLKGDRLSIAAAQAVASGVRHLSQREAGFERVALYKAALDFGLPTTISHVEHAVRALVRNGQLIEGKGAHKGWLASREAVELETRILAFAGEGRGAIAPSLTDAEAVERVQASAAINHGLTLNEGQLAAAGLILTSSDRTVAIQGVAGAGKSSVLKPVAEVLAEQGHPVIGLAVQNTLVQMLERDTGLRSQTLARFLKDWGKLIDEPGNGEHWAEAKAALGDHVLVLDEASMVANADKERLIRIANLASVHRLILMGDKKQLGAVDAGMPFALLQQGGVAKAEMSVNLRARDPVLRQAQAAAQAGMVHAALEHLKAHTVETKGDGAIVAAERWLALSPAERYQTMIFASGRRIRSAVNEAVQRGLLANREIGPETVTLGVLDRINLTREEMRYPAAYRPGMVLEVKKAERSHGLKRGEYNVDSIDEGEGTVRLIDKDGRQHRIRPSRVRNTGKDDNLGLYDPRKLELHRGDRIRWTRNDHERGLFNADRARILAIEGKLVTVETVKGDRVELKADDPMLRRIDLAYALNAHMAQGLTADRGIAVMDSRERNLANQKTFLVTVTRLRDHLTLVVDSASRLGGVMAQNKGEKTSALEVTERLRAAALTGSAKGHEAEEPSRSREELQREKSRALNIGI
jgi:conjugative relaxase-like TrwC/TraI family protein